MDIIIFKAGRMIGPLDHESVIGMLSRGEVSENDLAQRGGVEVWVPLRRFFPPPAKPTWIELALGHAREWGLKSWAMVHVDPLRIGLASLLAGCVLIIFPRWTFLLFVPALVVAVFAGAILITRRRFVSGALLSVGSLVLPALFLLAGRDDVRPRGRFQLFAAPSIEAVATPKPVAPARPPARASLQGIALPERVQPTPIPRPVPPI